MKKFKVWIHIEEIDEAKGSYIELESEVRSVGSELDTLEEARALKERLCEQADNVEAAIDATLQIRIKSIEEGKGDDAAAKKMAGEILDLVSKNRFGFATHLKAYLR